MKKNVLYLVLFSFLSQGVFSQNTIIAKWGYTFIPPCGSTSCFDIKTDMNGDHITTGSIYSTAGGLPFDLDPSPTNTYPTPGGNYNNDFYVAKYSPAGNFISAIILGGPSTDQCRSIAIDNGNNIITTGFFNGTMDFDPSPTGTVNATSNGGNDIFMAKYTNAGALLWVKTFGSTLSDIGSKVITDNQGNIFLSAVFSGTMDIDPSGATTNLVSNGNADVCLAKFDPNGNLLFGISFGDAGNESVEDLVLDAGKKLYVAGTFNGTVDFDPDPSTSFTIANNSGPADTYFCKFDSLLTYQWAKSLVCANVSGSRDINIDNTGNVLLSGFFYSAPIDLDPSPTTVTFAAAGGQSAFLAKYDNNGNYLWASVHGGNVNTDGNKAMNIWSDNSGNVYTTGYFTGLVDFDPSPATYTLNNFSTNPSLYYEKYDNAGNFISAQKLSGPGAVSATSHIDANGDLLFCGSLYGPANIDPTGNNPYVLSFSNGCGNFYTGFICKYTYCVLPVVNTVTSSANDLCPSQPLTLSITGTLNSSADWSWSRGSCGAASLGTGTSIVVTPTASGLYYVKGIGGCAGSVLGCTSISITTQPVPPLTLVSSFSGTICPNTNFTLTAGGAPTYTWSTGDTNNSIVTSASATTIYSVSTTGTSNCVFTRTIAPNIFPLQPLVRTLLSGPSLDVMCAGGLLNIKFSGGSQFNWNFNCFCPQTYSNNFNEAYVNFFQTQPAVYAYTVQSKDSNGCNNSETYTLTVDACTGIDQLSNVKNDIHVYPSPVGNTLLVETPLAVTRLRIINMAGQVLTENMTTVNDSKHALNTSELKPGVYFLEIYTNAGSVETRKIIKE